MVQLLQRFDQEVIDGKPDRPPPVGVAAEQAAFRFSRLVADGMGSTVYVKRIGMLLVVFRQRSDAVLGQKFVFI